MRIKANYILVTINVLALLLILIIAFIPNNVLRVILGTPLVLVFPGYTFLAALFPGRRGLNGIERLALSLGLSTAIVVFVGLGLNYTSWGIRLFPVLISLASFILITSIIAWFLSRRLPQENDILLHVDIKSLNFANLIPLKSTRDKIVSAVMAVLVISSIGILVYVANLPRETDKYTEFYVLNGNGKAENYPVVVTLGQNATIILGIVNHESTTIDYRIEITIEGEQVEDIGPISLDAGEKWQQAVTLKPTKIGANQKVVFQLYQRKTSVPGNTLNIWIDVQ